MVYVAAPLSARFSYATDTLCSRYLIHFKPAQSNAAAYRWDFGDSTSDTVPSPYHEYARDGAYLVRLWVTNGICDSVSSEKIVIALPPAPVAAFSVPEAKLCTGNPFQIQNHSSGKDLDYSFKIDSIKL
jgi:PKD repeat protein